MLSNPNKLTHATVLIVGEYASKKELTTGVSFNGDTGTHLIRTLKATGFQTNSIYFEPLFNKSPPYGRMNTFLLNKTQAKREKISEQHGAYPTKALSEARSKIQKLIRSVKPTLIISLGDVPMWATGGIAGSAVTWNGSQLKVQNINYMPIISPITVSKMWPLNIYFRHALKKASKFQTTPWQEPKYNFIVQPTFRCAMEYLNKIWCKLESWPKGQMNPLMHISCDLETRERHIACLGLGLSTTSAICIPFMKAEIPCAYWAPEEEYKIIHLLRDILTHPNALISGQNYNYDRQYFARYWGFRSNLGIDTMTHHHTYQPDMKKGLDILAFLYNDYYRYWKGESKDWDPHLGEVQLWKYNCIDCVVTWEVAEHFKNQKSSSFLDFQMEMHEPVLNMTLTGTRCDIKARDKMIVEVQEAIQSRTKWFEYLVGFNVHSKSSKPWWQSPAQTASFFYDVMNIKPVMKKNSKGGYSRTTNDDALETIKSRDPLVQSIAKALQELRSLNVFHNTFLTMPLDWDSRIRCQYLIDGTKTFRFASMNDAFWYGTNLQNIPRGNE